MPCQEQAYAPSNTTVGNMPTVPPTSICIASITPTSAVGTGNPGMSVLPVMHALSTAYAATMRRLPRDRATKSFQSALTTDCAFPIGPQ